MENELLKLIEELFIPNGVININGITYKIEREGDTLKIEFKTRIEEYKDAINELDDCMFLECLEEAKEQIDIKRFDELLEKKELTEEEFKEVNEEIDLFIDIIRNHISNKIDDLNELDSKLSMI